VFSIPNFTDYTLAGTYPVVVSAEIHDQSGEVTLSRTTTFNVILTDPCLTTVISLSSSYPDITAYVNQGNSLTYFPTYSDSVSTASSNS
jgi:hypothetical protein